MDYPDEMRDAEITRVTQWMTRYPTRAVFVFGSNLAGQHVGGAARQAADEYGAEEGVGIGPTGQSWAIATLKTPGGDQLPLDDIARQVRALLVAAGNTPAQLYIVTRIGCGIAGFTDEQIAPMFAGAFANIKLPYTWEAWR